MSAVPDSLPSASDEEMDEDFAFGLKCFYRFLEINSQHLQPQIVCPSHAPEQPRVIQTMPSHGGQEVAYQGPNGVPVDQEASQVQQPLWGGPDVQRHVARQHQHEAVPSGTKGSGLEEPPRKRWREVL